MGVTLYTDLIWQNLLFPAFCSNPYISNKKKKSAHWKRFRECNTKLIWVGDTDLMGKDLWGLNMYNMAWWSDWVAERRKKDENLHEYTYRHKRAITHCLRLTCMQQWLLKWNSGQETASNCKEKLSVRDTKFTQNSSAHIW